MTNEEIHEYIEQNCRNEHGESMMDEQTFYEGAKWYRDMVVINNTVLPRDIDMRCPYCKSENIVWYGLSGDCVCNKCGKEGSIII